MNDTITYVKSSGKDVEKVVALIEAATKGVSYRDVMIACISIALIYQIPNIDYKQLLDGIKGSTEWIALFASSLESGNSAEKGN